MSSPVTEAGSYINFSATTTISQPNVQLLGVFVSSTSGTATLTVSDGASTAISTFIPLAGTFYPFPLTCKTSAVFTVNGTLSATALFTM